MGNHVIVIRKEGEKYAHGHIGTDGFDRVFCGDYVPKFILETWTDPHNPYKGKGKVTCTACLAEFNNGRREGWREENTPMVDSTETP